MRKIIIASLLCIALCVGNLSGGWKKHNFDAKNNEVDNQALDAALTGVRAEAQNGELYEYQGIESCEIQLVSGLRYRLTLNYQNAEDEVRQYEVIVYLVPWENYVEVQSVKDVTAKNLSGDLAENNVLREQVLSFVEQQIRMRANRDLSAYELVGYEILSMKVVQGNIYELRIDLLNKQEETAAPLSFSATVWSRPWLSPPLEITELKDFKPTESLTQTDDSMSGGSNEYKWNGNSEIEVLALRALTNYAQEHVAEDFVLVAVKKASSQVVAGIKFTLTFDYTAGGEQKSAEATILLQPWQNVAQVTEFRVL